MKYGEKNNQGDQKLQSIAWLSLALFYVSV